MILKNKTTLSILLEYLIASKLSIETQTNKQTNVT